MPDVSEITQTSERFSAGKVFAHCCHSLACSSAYALIFLHEKVSEGLFYIPFMQNSSVLTFMERKNNIQFGLLYNCTMKENPVLSFALHQFLPVYTIRQNVQKFYLLHLTGEVTSKLHLYVPVNTTLEY